MPQGSHTITAADIMDLAEFEIHRKEMRTALLAKKKLRRIAVGPDAMFYFESYDTMWMQIHEMLRIEKGGEEQLVDELAAYNPMIPKGAELTATLMFEIDDERRRARVLGALGGVEETVFLKIGNEKIFAEAEQDVDRTNADGKASSVQFLHFSFTAAQIEAFKDLATEVVLGIRHEAYPHMAAILAASRAELAHDFD